MPYPNFVNTHLDQLPVMHPCKEMPTVWRSVNSTLILRIERRDPAFMAICIEDSERVFFGLAHAFRDTSLHVGEWRLDHPSSDTNILIRWHKSKLHISGYWQNSSLDLELMPDVDFDASEVVPAWERWQGCWEGVAALEVQLSYVGEDLYAQIFSLGEARYQVEPNYWRGILVCQHANQYETQWRLQSDDESYFLLTLDQQDGHLEVTQIKPHQRFHAYLIEPVTAQIPQEIQELQALLEAIPKHDHTTVIENWYHALAEQSLPRVEYTPQCDQANVLFLYKGQSCDHVDLISDFKHWFMGQQRMRQIGCSGVFYHAVNCPSDARFDYKFLVNGQQILDTNNSQCVTRQSNYHNNWLALQGWLYRDHLNSLLQPPLQELTVLSLFSEALQQQRSIWLYLPRPIEHIEQARLVRMVYVHDGDMVLSDGYYPRLFDLLQASFQDQFLICVMLPTQNRIQEYGLNAAYIRFVGQELIPYVDHYLALSQRNVPIKRYMTGISMGALTTLACHQALGGALAGIGLQSPAGPNALIKYILEQLSVQTFVNQNIYLDYACFDYQPWQQFAQRLHQILPKQSMRFHAWHDGHSFGNYQVHSLTMFKHLFMDG